MKQNPRDFRNADDLLKFYTDQIVRVEERIDDMDNVDWRTEQKARLRDRRADLERQRDILAGLHQLVGPMEQLHLPEHDADTGEIAMTGRLSLLDERGIKHTRNVSVGGAV
mgnify:CR=1 FL=1